MLDLHRLRLLRELSMRGTIAATARACALTPSAVSQQLSLLRREAGTELLIRDGRRLVLTEAATVLVAHTEKILAELEAAEAGLASLSGHVSGVVRLAAFPTAASALVPGAISKCRAEYPELDVRLEESETVEGIPALKAGHLDALIVYEFNLMPKINDPGIELVPLVTESLLAAVPQTLPLPRGRLRLGALRDQPWIAPSSDSALRATLERACALSGFQPRLNYTSDDYTVILSLVRAGLGVSLIPQLATERIASGVRLRRVAEPTLTRVVSIALRAGSASVPRHAAITAALHQTASRLALTLTE